MGWAILALFLVLIAGQLLAASEMRRISINLHRRTISPARAMGDYGLLAFGALLLAVPGFVSSLAGLLLITPPIRAGIRHTMAQRLRASVESFGMKGFEAVNTYRQRASYGTFAEAKEGTLRPDTTAAQHPEENRSEVIDESEIAEWMRTVSPEDFSDKPHNSGSDRRRADNHDDKQDGDHPTNEQGEEESGEKR